jgi:hypothetical protein
MIAKGCIPAGGKVSGIMKGDADGQVGFAAGGVGVEAIQGREDPRAGLAF